MLNKSLFLETLMSAQWKISQSGSIPQEKLHVYWEEFKDVPLTDEQFLGCVVAVSRRSNFFPKAAEIWDEVGKVRSKSQTPATESLQRARGTPRPSWFDEIYALGREEQKERQNTQNGGRYVGSPAY